MGMEQYMGIQALMPQAASDTKLRDLPLFNIGGTDFIVDMKNHVFQEKDNPDNKMTLGPVKEEYGFSFFYYDPSTRNRYNGPIAEVPKEVMLIIVPPLKELDPIGLARKHGLRDGHYQSAGQKTSAEQLPQLRQASAKAHRYSKKPKIK